MSDEIDPRDVHRALDLSLRVGEMLMSNGAGAADVTATMSSILWHAGLRQALVDVTFTTLAATWQPAFDQPAYSLTRHVTQREVDYADLTAVDHVVTALLTDEIDLDEARTRLAQISSTGHSTPRWAITLGWGVTGLGIAFIIGGDWAVAVIAGLAGMGLEILQRFMSRRRLPFFYTQVVGGLLASLFAVLVSTTDFPVSPSQAITASIVLQLAGLGLIGAIQDALTGFPVTATARILEVLMSTAGIIVGVSGGLAVAGTLGVDIALDTSPVPLSQLPVAVAGGAVTAAGFAFTAYAPGRILLPMGVIGAGAVAVFGVLTTQDLGRAWPAAVAAVLIGLVSYTVASWTRVPPLVIVVTGIVPLLPGLSIYRALSLLSNDNLVGFVAMFTAIAVAISLAAGVILGEYMAQPLRKEARRLEQRLAGPRLVGPLRVRSLRRRGR